MLIRIDDTTGVPLHAQIASQIRRAIASDQAREGARLPPVRSLARDLEVNMHTVLHAYRDLEAEGLLELRQGRGATVRRGGRRRARHLADLAQRLVSEGAKAGLDPMQLAGLLRAEV